MSNKFKYEERDGLKIEDIFIAISSLPEAPAFSEIAFVENDALPNNTVIVSPKMMRLLKKHFEVKKND